MSAKEKQPNPHEMGFAPVAYPKFRDGISMLSSSFVWAETRQGHDYWQSVVQNVAELDELFARYMVERREE